MIVPEIIIASGLCIVVEHTACWPIMYVASVPACLPPTGSVDWTNAVLCLMAGEAEVYNAYNAFMKNLCRIRIYVFFTKPAETDRLQDFENRNNTIFVVFIFITFSWWICNACFH